MFERGECACECSRRRVSNGSFRHASSNATSLHRYVRFRPPRLFLHSNLLSPYQALVSRLDAANHLLYKLEPNTIHVFIDIDACLLTSCGLSHLASLRICDRHICYRTLEG